MEKPTFLTRHLHDAHETYFQHLGFTIKVAFTLVLIAIIVVLHGLMPFIFTHTASGMLCKLMDQMKARKILCESRHACHTEKIP